MGKTTGFMDYSREENHAEAPAVRVKHWNEFHTQLPESERREQAARCKDCGVPFCQTGTMIQNMTIGCPLHNLIPEWNDFLWRGNYEQAVHRLKRTNNFPEFTSRVCPAICESACTGHLHGAVVTNKENELFLAEYGFSHNLMGPFPPAVRSGKKVAVIGSGPAGLAAADRLNQRGHLVTVYERDDRPGGLLMYGIPNMKLDKSVVKRRTDMMAAEGVIFETGMELGKNLKADQLLAEYDAVVIATGATRPRDIEAPGRDAEGICYAVDYLTAATRHLLDSDYRVPAGLNMKGRRVLIIGGGDTGTDCIATAVRQGAKSVMQFDRHPCPPKERTEDNPWPTWPKILRTDYGEEEAIAVYGKDPRVYESSVKEFIKDENGKLTGVIAVKRKEGKRDPVTGKILTEEIPGSEFEVKCDRLIIAGGFAGAEKEVPDSFGLKLTGRGNIKTEENDIYRTDNPKVFAAGDCRRGQSLVVWAIREGREAAREVDLYLMGYTGLR